MKFYHMTGLLFPALLLILFGCEPPQEKTPAQQWEHFISGQKVLGCEVLSVAASEAWIEKHRDEISIPNQIVFGKPHHVQDFGFVPYGIMIAVDANDKRRVIARKWLPEKTLLKVGDTLTTGFPIEFDLDSFGRGSEAIESFKKHFENQSYNFVFEAKETILRHGLPVPNYMPFVEAKVEQAKAEEAFYNSFAPDKGTIYMSPNGATISYNGFRIVTKIEGSVFQRSYDLTAIATSLLE